jgi:hypothetical protein
MRLSGSGSDLAERIGMPASHAATRAALGHQILLKLRRCQSRHHESRRGARRRKSISCSRSGLKPNCRCGLGDVTGLGAVYSAGRLTIGSWPRIRLMQSRSRRKRKSGPDRRASRMRKPRRYSLIALATRGNQKRTPGLPPPSDGLRS